MSKHTYLVPDYYIKFECKCGNCRSTCCQGWTVSLSLSEYYRLIGLQCSKHLRKQLDCAFEIAEYPDNERYAVMKPKWNGECPMHNANGLCDLHHEKGELILPSVCRYYPRAPRFKPKYECSCSNSCEAVVEMFINRDEPITFVETELDFNLDENASYVTQFNKSDYISVIQNRSLALRDRLSEIVPQEFTCDNIVLQKLLFTEFCSKSPSFAPYLSDILYSFDYDYDRNVRHLYEIIPDIEKICEHLLVNHIFYECYSSIALGAVYSLLRFVCAGYMYNKTEPEKFVDITAAAFRMIEHSDFGKISAKLLKNMVSPISEFNSNDSFNEPA